MSVRLLQCYKKEETEKKNQPLAKLVGAVTRWMWNEGFTKTDLVAT